MIRLYYPNCDCCSGSGSSGSGSCSCNFYWASALCDSTTHCPTEYVATIRLNFSGCGSSPIGSCGSGSSGSDTEPTASGSVIPIGTGSSGSSGSSCRVCPDCCSIANKAWQINLVCVGGDLVSENLIYGAGGSSCFGSGALEPQSGSSDCLGFRSDRCLSASIAGGLTIGGSFWLPLDGGYLIVESGPLTVSSCNPFLMSGIVGTVRPGGPTISTSSGGFVTDYPSIYPCLSPCLDSSYFIANGFFSCVTGTVTVTEAASGGGGGGGGGGPPPPV